MPRLTERSVERAKPRKAKYELSCSVLTGFVLRVLPSGKKAYYIRFRDADGKDRRVRLGSTTELGFAEAKQLALEKLTQAEAPAPAPPPSSRRKSAKTRPAATPSQVGPRAPLFKDFADRFLHEHVAVRLKPGTRRNYRYYLRKTLIPRFGHLPLDEITRTDVARLHASLADTPGTANSNLQILSSLYSRAAEWGVLGHDFSPPTRGVKKYRNRTRERFLSPQERAELERFLSNALEVGANRPGGLRWHSVTAIRLLSMTGMRRDEVLDLTWDMVDYHHRCFRLPESKTGQKVVPVSDDVLELVRECRRVWETYPYKPKPRHVIYSRNGKRIWSSALSRTWCKKIRSQLPGFEDVRLHDLRHSMASDAIMAGVPLAVVGKILGHRKAETTARYAHIADSVLSDAVQTVSKAIRHSSQTGERLADSEG